MAAVVVESPAETVSQTGEQEVRGRECGGAFLKWQEDRRAHLEETDLTATRLERVSELADLEPAVVHPQLLPSRVLEVLVGFMGPVVAVVELA